MTTLSEPQATGCEPAIDQRARVGGSVLVVDDSRLDREWAGYLIETRIGMRPICVDSGEEALAVLERETPEVVLTDLRMPAMDGLELVQTMRSRFPLVPVVLMTAFGSEEIALQALRDGAASYVPKRRLAQDLGETLGRVLASAKADRNMSHLLDGLTQSESHFTLGHGTSVVSALVARLRDDLSVFRVLDENSQIRVDVALHEALLNAIYHGNLEVSSDLRQDDETAFQNLAEQRRSHPPYNDRRLHVRARFTRSEAVYQIRDEGPGFDHTSLPDPADPLNMDRASGRGLLLIRTFMDEVKFNSAGNEIVMVKRRRVANGKTGPPGALANGAR